VVLEMVLYRLPTLGVLEFEDEVNLVGGATLVRSKHYGVRRLIIEFLGFPSNLLGTEVLQVGTTTLKSILQPNLKL
jgi:hypothetical protein